MATRSRIGIELKNGSVLSVYHHWDGYPEWLGRILTTHYNTKDKVTELIDGGDMSSCWTEGHCDDSTDGNYGPEYYSKRGENCPPLVMMLTFVSICSPIIVKSMLMSSVVVSGCAIICISLLTTNSLKLLRFPLEH